MSTSSLYNPAPSGSSTPDFPKQVIQPLKQYSEALNCSIIISLITDKSDKEIATFAVALFHTDGETHLDNFTLELDTLEAIELVTSRDIFPMIERMYLNVQQQIKNDEKLDVSIN